MTAKAVQIQTNGVVTAITETGSAGVTPPTSVQPYLPSISVAHKFLPKLFQEVHMMKTHILDFANALPVFLVGSLKERLSLLNQ
jgi:hypothetical protein